MKFTRYKILSALALIFLGTLSFCGEEELSASGKVKKLLVGNGSKIWKMKSLTIDGAYQYALFTGFTIQFAGNGTYTTTNGGIMWPSPDTWEFVDPNATYFYRADGADVEIEVTENQLTLSLLWAKTTLGGGRSNSITGHHVFHFGL